MNIIAIKSIKSDCNRLTNMGEKARRERERGRERERERQKSPSLLKVDKGG